MDFTFDYQNRKFISSLNIENKQSHCRNVFITEKRVASCLCLTKCIINILLFSSFINSVQLSINDHSYIDNDNNLPLLAGTLRTYQVSACDNEELHLKCDSQTVVSIVYANYGQSVPERRMCSKKLHRSAESWPSNPWSNGVKDDNSSLLTNHNNRCPEAKHLWYKFLLKIEKTCRQQHSCSLLVNATNFGFKHDPCTNLVKYAEVAYRCRPNKFINKIACEGRQLQLQCANHSNDDRILIFSSMFGSNWHGVNECPGSAIKHLNSLDSSNQTNLEHLCQDNNSLTIVKQLCHAKKNCIIPATYYEHKQVSHFNHFNDRTFSIMKCPILVKYYLKVVYTCLPKQHIYLSIDTNHTDRSQSTTTAPISSSTTSKATPDLIEAQDTSENDDEQPNYKSIDANLSTKNTRFMMDSASTATATTEKSWHTKYMTSNSVNDTNKSNSNAQQHSLINNCTELTTQMQFVGFVSDWISAIDFIKRNQELLVLYLSVSLLGSLVCFLAVLSARLYYQKNVTVKRIRQQHKHQLQQQQRFVSQFNFDDEDFDDEDNNNNNNDGHNHNGDDNHNMTTNNHSNANTILKTLDSNIDDNQLQQQTKTTATSASSNIDYHQIKRQSIHSTITSTILTATTTTSTGYSTIRRPHSSHLSTTANTNQSPTMAGHTGNDQMIAALRLHQTLNRPRHHHHSHQHQSVPIVYYSDTPRTASLSNSMVDNCANMTLPSSTTLPKSIKSILRDSSMQTPILLMDIRPQSDNVNSNFRTITFENESKIATIDLMPPPPLLSSESIKTTCTSSPSSMMIDGKLVSFDHLYSSQVIRCPKFPIIPLDNASNLMQPFSMPVSTVTTTNHANREQLAHSITTTVTPIIHHTIEQQTSGIHNDDSNTKTITVTSTLTTPTTKMDPTKPLTSNLANFLV